MKPILVINFKTYKKATGRNALKLAKKIKKVLKEEKYLIIFCKDEYQNGELREKSSSLAEIIKQTGFQWKGKITWYQAGAKLRPYGVPYSYVPNITDQKILIFKNSSKVGREHKNEAVQEVELNDNK